VPCFSLSLQTPPTPYSSTTSHKVMTCSLSQRPLDTGRSSALPRSSFFRVFGSRFQLSTRDPGYRPESPSLATGCSGERDRKFYTVSEPGTPGLSDQEFSLCQHSHSQLSVTEGPVRILRSNFPIIRQITHTQLSLVRNFPGGSSLPHYLAHRASPLLMDNGQFHNFTGRLPGGFYRSTRVLVFHHV